MIPSAIAAWLKAGYGRTIRISYVDGPGQGPAVSLWEVETGCVHIDSRASSIDEALTRAAEWCGRQ